MWDWTGWFDICNISWNKFKKNESIIQSGRYDMVTHRVHNKKVGKTLVINPGTANGWFFGYGETAAVLDKDQRIWVPIFVLNTSFTCL